MRTADGVKKTVVYIGKKVGGTFTPYGTGFVVANLIDAKVFQNIVTARHVIENMGAVKDVIVRVNRRNGPAHELPLDRNHWHFHVDSGVDVAVCPTIIPTNQFDILHLSTEHVLTDEIIEKFDIGIGDDVFVAGMFVSIPGEARNIPIIRCGTVAAMPEEMIRTTYGHHLAYLVELKSTGGLSGSPAFLQMAPWRSLHGNHPQMMTGLPQYLMGIVLGHNRLQTNEDTLEVVPIARTVEEERNRIEMMIPLNTGIAVILPIKYVIEAIEQPQIADRRKEAIKNAAAGYSPDAARAVGMESPTKAENPPH